MKSCSPNSCMMEAEEYNSEMENSRKDQILDDLQQALENKNWELLGYRSIEQGDMFTAPGINDVWVRDPCSDRNVVYRFFNAQDKGFHSGHYDLSEETAREMIGDVQ